MRIFFLASALLAAVFFAPSSYGTAIDLIGSACHPSIEIGATKISPDGASIIACLWDDSAQKQAHWKGISINNATFNCPDGQVLVRVINGSPICTPLTPFSAGGVDIVYENITNIFGYCRFAWGAVTACSPGGVVCARGRPRITSKANDVLALNEDQSQDGFLSDSKNGATVHHIECIVE